MENFTINREKKTFVFDDGEELPIPKDKEKQVLRTPYAKSLKEKSKEGAKTIHDSSFLPSSFGAFQTGASESFLGNPGATLAEYITSGVKGISPGEGQENLGFIDRVLDNFYAMQEGRKEFQNELAEKHPIATGLGQATGIGGELLALRKLPATAALPVMGAAHSETSFLEPGAKAGEVTRDALTGLLLDGFFGAASKVAGHRQTRRLTQDAIRSAEEGNLAEIQRATAATEAEQARFATETAAREAELARLPELQRVENEAFVQSSAQKVNRVAQTLGKTPIASEAMGVETFISDVIESSAFAGTKEGKRVSNFLRTIFKGNAEGKLTGQSIEKGMRAVDEVIAKEGGVVGEILTNFRKFVSQELPSKIGNYYAYEKWVPKIQGRLIPLVEGDLVNSFKHSGEVYRDVQGQLGKGFLQDLNQSIKSSIEDIFKTHIGDFEFVIADGTLQNEIRAAIEANPKYQALLDNVLEYETIVGTNKKYGAFNLQRPNVPSGFYNIKLDLMDYPNQIADKFSKIAQKYMPDIKLDIGTKSGVSQRSLSQLPQGPNVLQAPPPIAPAQQIVPNLAPVPQMPQPQGVFQKLAHGLEKIQETGMGGAMQAAKENAPTGFLAKMAGVPVAKFVAGAAGAITGANILTSPSLAGQIGRGVLKQTAMAMYSVEQRAERYPSYKGNGILADPMERRSLVKEIEEDFNMSLEDKAVIQSKINRGEPLIPPGLNK